MNGNNALQNALPTGQVAWTIDEWCHRYNIKRGLYYKLDDRPFTIHLGAKILITVEADKEWRERQNQKARAASASDGRAA